MFYVLSFKFYRSCNRGLYNAVSVFRSLRLYFRSCKLDVAEGGMCRNQRTNMATVPSGNVT